MNYYNAKNSIEYQHYFYNQVGLTEEVTTDDIRVWSNKGTCSIVNFGAHDVIQCGIGNYKIPQDFMIRYDYNMEFLHFGIIYNGIAYSVKNNNLNPTVTPSVFLSKERTNGGIHCWKKGQEFKGVEISIEFEYLSQKLLPILGHPCNALDFLEYNVRYTTLPAEMVNVIKNIELNLDKRFMSKPLLMSFCIQFVIYLLKDEHRHFFSYEDDHPIYVLVGKRKIQLTEEDLKKIFHVYQSINEDAESFSSIMEFSQKYHISEQKLKAGFKKLYGCSIWEFSNSVRMRIAAEYLQKTCLPVNEIAKKIGYQSQAAFIKAFKQYTGITPKQFKTQARENL